MKRLGFLAALFGLSQNLGLIILLSVLHLFVERLALSFVLEVGRYPLSRCQYL